MDTLSKGFFCPKCDANLLGANHNTGCPLLPEKAAGGEKLSNPKDIIGSDKVPLSIVPGTTKAYLAIGHLEGMLKYGYVNWREAGVRTSIYLDALERHLEKFKNGEWCDEETKVPHLANAIACISIIIDAYECGKLTDDRPKQAPVADVLARMSENVKHLRKIYGHCNPHHYTYDPGPQAPADLYDGATEKRKDDGREEAIEKFIRSHREAGRYQAGTTRAEVSGDSGTARQGILRSNDTKSVPERTFGGHLRRDELLPTGERLSSFTAMDDSILRDLNTTRSVYRAGDIDQPTGPCAGNSGNVGKKRIFDER